MLADDRIPEVLEGSSTSRRCISQITMHNTILGITVFHKPQDLPCIGVPYGEIPGVPE